MAPYFEPHCSIVGRFQSTVSRGRVVQRQSPSKFVAPAQGTAKVLDLGPDLGPVLKGARRGNGDVGMFVVRALIGLLHMLCLSMKPLRSCFCLPAICVYLCLCARARLYPPGSGWHVMPCVHCMVHLSGFLHVTAGMLQCHSVRGGLGLSPLCVHAQTMTGGVWESVWVRSVLPWGSALCGPNQEGASQPIWETRGVTGVSPSDEVSPCFGHS